MILEKNLGDLIKMKYIKVFLILLILMFSVSVVSATTLNITTLSNNVKYSNVTERTTNSVTPVLLSSITINDSIFGRQNLTVEFHSTYTISAAEVSLRKNGVEVGRSSTTSLTYTIFQFNTTENFTWQVGDTYELWGFVHTPSVTAYYRNFNMSYDISSYPLQLLSPANGSTFIGSFNITWREAPLNFSYTYQVSTDSNPNNIVSAEIFPIPE